MTHIVSVEVGNDPWPTNAPGEFVTMSDGQRWFHPFDGPTPVRIS